MAAASNRSLAVKYRDSPIGAGILYGMVIEAAIAKALRRAEWQPALFATPNRARLAECVPDWPCHTLRINVHRNHGIEAVSAATAPYAAWNGMSFDWSIGPYDDTISFGVHSDADVEVFWLDTDRLAGLAGGGIAPWLIGRLHARRAQTTRPIVVLAWPLTPEDRELLQNAPVRGVYIADLQPLASELGASWLDPRTAALSGTRLSNRACLQVARELACRWLPAAVQAPVKCVALDLDGTLYEGVLGEDGALGVVLGDGHRFLHQLLLDLRRGGMLLALVSRNDRSDVEALFEARSDFPLRLTDFSVVEVSWGDKAAALARIARQLRIGLDAIVFVDDNPGELAAVSAESPVVTVHAGLNARETACALAHVAGVFRWKSSAEDDLRAMDLHAAAQRDEVGQRSLTPDEYLRSLAVRLRYHVGAPQHLGRAAELLKKTNQFNLSLRRLNEAEVAQRMESHPANVVTIELADRLADSGIVGVLVGAVSGGTLRVEEVAISCRALGRRLEDGMLTQALRLMADGSGVDRVIFDCSVGPRNAPARQWLAAYSGLDRVPETECVSMAMSAIAAKPVSDAISITVQVPETLA